VRQDRRRLRTRTALLDSARRCMGERGIDAVTIAEIAAEADVAFGSFYNHFDSKDAIVEALVVELLDALGELIDATIADIDDPAAALAVAFRMAQGGNDRSWAAFMVRAAVADRRVLDGILARARRDIERGIAAGRLTVPDLDAAMTMLAGALLFASEGGVDPGACAEMLLRMLGVAPDEASRLVRS
jgi:AcrR family transcriptional regulator